MVCLYVDDVIVIHNFLATDNPECLLIPSYDGEVSMGTVITNIHVPGTEGQWRECHHNIHHQNRSKPPLGLNISNVYGDNIQPQWQIQGEGIGGSLPSPRGYFWLSV